MWGDSSAGNSSLPSMMETVHYMIYLVLLYMQHYYVEGYIWTYAISQPQAEGAYENEELHPKFLHQRDTKSGAELSKLDNETKRHYKVRFFYGFMFFGFIPLLCI